MGMCEIDESTISPSNNLTNKILLICELSTYVLYQYVFLVLWYCMVTSITISVLGLLAYLCRCLYFCVPLTCTWKSTYRHITLRQMDHLDFIESKNIVAYIAIIRMLQGDGKEDGKEESMKLEEMNDF